MAETMTAKERREAILCELERAEGPVSASALAKQFHVSRQAVVGDVAMLRALNAPIAATPRGYVLTRSEGTRENLHDCVPPWTRPPWRRALCRR